MNAGDIVEQSLDERRSSSALLVLGMHRSGTSAITGALGLCGAWVGEETKLTGKSVQNPYGFWERRDIRQICDRLLHAASANWWKVADFNPEAIPHAVRVEQRRNFAAIISSLNEHATWVIKEPRLCLLLPVLRDHITNLVCIHIFRNPLGVARSLQTRNGFGIAAGLALWEAYNYHALRTSKGLPRVMLSHESLMLHPIETLNRLIGQLDELSMSGLVRPNEDHLTTFINPSFYHHRVTEEETNEYLSPSQRILWQQIRSEQIFDQDMSSTISRVTREHLFDLESSERSLEYYKNKPNKLIADLEKRDTMIHNMGKKLNAKIKKRDMTIRSLLASTSWRITAPLRALSHGVRWFRRNLRRRAAKLIFWLRTGQFSRLRKAAVSYCKKNSRENKLKKNLIKEAETSFEDGDLSISLAFWQRLLTRFSKDEKLSGIAKSMVSIIGRLSDLNQYRRHIQCYAKLSKKNSLTENKIRIVIFTAIVDHYNSIKLPEQLNPNFDYVLFTDSPVANTGIWQVRPITYLHGDKIRSARFIKTHPHILLNDYDIAVWIDSNIMILYDIYYIIDEFLSSGKSVGAIPHPLRKSIYEEIIACRDRGKDEKDVMKEQIAKYKRKCFSHRDLIESNFMIFDSRNNKTKCFLDNWWREIDCHSRRDQLSLNYALSETDLDWYRLMKRPNSIRNHPNFAFTPHDNGLGPNIKLIEALQPMNIDPYDGPPYAEVKQSRLRDQKTRTIDIIVCVHNALDDAQRCLESVLKTRNNTPHRLIIIDDGSDMKTAEYLRHFADTASYCELHRNNEAQGYTKAANRGLAASTGEFVLLLNSDTIVTDSWVEKLSDAVFSTPGAGIVGPLSNAASYQSIPEYRGTSNQTAINVLPSGMTPEDMNDYCERSTVAHILPLVPLVHGFCFGITRRLIDKIGYFDVDNFPKGYGEENDYCFRATDAGFTLVIATHTYIFHAKSKSYLEHERIPLVKTTSQAFRRIYGHARIKRAQHSMEENPILMNLRKQAGKLYPGRSRDQYGKIKGSRKNQDHIATKNMLCNICGGTSFVDMKSRKNVKCSACESLERTRIMALFIDYYDLAHKDTRILHIAPERGLAESLYKIAGKNCVFVDLAPENFSFSKRLKVEKLDLCKDLEFINDNSYDLIIHSHVIEHILCNYTYVLHHLHRIMSEEGTMLCSIPIMSGYFDYSTVPGLSSAERLERFGQKDHTTRFGRKDLHMHLGKVIRINDTYDLTDYFSEDDLMTYNIPRRTWKGYSVYVLRKSDFLIEL